MDKLQELEQKHGQGRVLEFEAEDGAVLYFVIPSQGDHERFVEKSQKDGETKTVALREYVLSSVADEKDRESYSALFGRWPAMPDVIATELIRHAKGGIKLREKKSPSTSKTPSAT